MVTKKGRNGTCSMHVTDKKYTYIQNFNQKNVIKWLFRRTRSRWEMLKYVLEKIYMGVWTAFTRQKAECNNGCSWALQWNLDLASKKNSAAGSLLQLGMIGVGNFWHVKNFMHIWLLVTWFRQLLRTDRCSLVLLIVFSSPYSNLLFQLSLPLGYLSSLIIYMPSFSKKQRICFDDEFFLPGYNAL
jgi:hypothetical protein